MSVSISRLGARPRAAWAIALWLVVGVVAPAAATPVTVFFDGPSGYGVVAPPSGVPIVDPDYLVDSEGILSVIDQDVLISSVQPFPPIADSGNTLTSIWIVENESSYDLLGDAYMLFVTTLPREFGGEVVEYVDSNVGLSIDPDLGWVLIHASEGGQDYYYPAMSLGSLAPGETADSFAMNFVVNEPLQQVGNTYVLPLLQVGLGFTPTLIPEPNAAALLGLGLVLLATARRLRS